MTEDEMLDGVTDSMDMSLSKLREIEEDREPGVPKFMGLQRVGHDWATEQQQRNKRKAVALELSMNLQHR